jgi:hypothetical protein
MSFDTLHTRRNSREQSMISILDSRWTPLVLVLGMAGVVLTVVVS